MAFSWTTSAVLQAPNSRSLSFRHSAEAGCNSVCPKGTFRCQGQLEQLIIGVKIAFTMGSVWVRHPTSCLLFSRCLRSRSWVTYGGDWGSWKLAPVGEEPFLPRGKSCSSQGFLCRPLWSHLHQQAAEPLGENVLKVSVLSSAKKPLFALKYQRLWILPWFQFGKKNNWVFFYLFWIVLNCRAICCPLIPTGLLFWWTTQWKVFLMRLMKHHACF